MEEAKLMEVYKNADEKDKPQILEAINKKQSESAQKIIELNEEMSEEYKEFEKKLRSEQ